MAESITIQTLTQPGVGAIAPRTTANAVSVTGGGNLQQCIDLICNDGAGPHNSVYRGKKLGTTPTAAQYAAIGDGTFKDIYPGDYWETNGNQFRVMACDYYFNQGDQTCTTHHVVIVPDGQLYTAPMNDTNTTAGAYVNSKMYTEGLEQAKTTIETIFGAEHILQHRVALSNAGNNGFVTGISWYDSKVELMTERNVYGNGVFSDEMNGSSWVERYNIDYAQFPAFFFNKSLINATRQWYWLRDITSASDFCYVGGRGACDKGSASSSGCVRPAFCLKA